MSAALLFLRTVHREPGVSTPGKADIKLALKGRGFSRAEMSQKTAGLFPPRESKHTFPKETQSPIEFSRNGTHFALICAITLRKPFRIKRQFFSKYASCPKSPKTRVPPRTHLQHLKKRGPKVVSGADTFDRFVAPRQDAIIASCSHQAISSRASKPHAGDAVSYTHLDVYKRQG